MNEKPLTVKQQRFVDFFDGNATDAARKAGYKSAELSGLRNIRNVRIAKAIKKREKKRNRKKIATREERQQLWTEFARNEDVAIRDRLKALELLGRSECDFIDKKEITGANGGPIQTQTEVIEILLSTVDGATRGLANNEQKQIEHKKEKA